jgi:hypothetical protein
MEIRGVFATKSAEKGKKIPADGGFGGEIGNDY